MNQKSDHGTRIGQTLIVVLLRPVVLLDRRRDCVAGIAALGWCAAARKQLPLDDPELASIVEATTVTTNITHHVPHITTILRPFFRDHPGEPVPEENFWTFWCKERLTEADTPTIWLGATPSGLTRAHLHHPPFFTGWMPFLPPNQQHQSTEGN